MSQKDTNNLSNRESLRSFFSSGKFPSQGNFASLIESVINLEDDGIQRMDTDADKGIGIYSGSDNSLLSFYKSKDDSTPIWKFVTDDAGNLKIIAGGSADSILLLSANGSITVGSTSAEADLTILGKITAKSITVEDDITAESVEATNLEMAVTGEVDGAAISTVPADKKWYKILGPLKPMEAFSLFASVDSSTKYKAIIYSTNFFLGSKKSSKIQKVNVQRKGWPCNRIYTKFKKVDDKFYLMIRSGKNISGGNINFFINHSFAGKPVNE